MSATTFPHHHSPAATRTRSLCEPAPEPTPDHGFLTKFVVAILLNVGIVAIIAPFGWAFLPAAVAIQIVTAAALLHATFRLLTETDHDGR